MVNMVDVGESLPIRLVQENGDTIALDATSVDIVVERQQSNFGIPFFDAKKMSIDLNQAAVAIEVQGVFADDLGQEPTAQATASIDFYQPQQIVNTGGAIGAGGGSSSSITSGYNLGTLASSLRILLSGGGFLGGSGGSLGNSPVDVNDLGNKILRHWNHKYIELPVAFWTESDATLTNPVTSGLQLQLAADTMDSTLSNNDSVASWTDSSGNGRNATQANATYQPKFKTNGANGKSFMRFDGSNDLLSIPYTGGQEAGPFLNPVKDFTIMVVASQANDAEAAVIDSTSGSTGGGDAKGYALHMDTRASNRQFRSVWESGSSSDSASFTVTSTVDVDDVQSGTPTIMSFTMADTTANGSVDTVNGFHVSRRMSTKAIGATPYTATTTGPFQIGKGGATFFEGDIYEILMYNRVLSQDEREQVEGYLSRKYNIAVLDSPYEGVNYNPDTKHLRVIFDKDLVASKQEPFGFNNARRDTGLTVGAGASGNTIPVSGGNPQEWFEPTESNRRMTVMFHDGNQFVTEATNDRIFLPEVVSVTATGIILNRSIVGTAVGASNRIYISYSIYSDVKNLGIGSPNRPTLVIPIKNADTFDENANPEQAVGPEFPPYEDGTARDDGGGISRTDEYIAYLFSNIITADYIVTKQVDAVGSNTLDKAFSSSIVSSYHGHNSRVDITQQYPSALGGKLSDPRIKTNLSAGQTPAIQGFTGGRSAKRVKSAGDKVQDILGVLGNSQNFHALPDLNGLEAIFEIGLDFIQQTLYNNSKAKGDYIRGIQIPYDTLATKGKSVFDVTNGPQRNFFLTTEGSTTGKLSNVNNIHASRFFSHSSEGHEKNGISGLVTDFNVHRDAEMKAYEFSLKFVAADVIL